MFRMVAQDIPYAEAVMCHSCGYFYSEDLVLCTTCKESVRTTITCPYCDKKETFTGAKSATARCVYCQSLLPNLTVIEVEDRERLRFHISKIERDKRND
jgi:hypothetical protein